MDSHDLFVLRAILAAGFRPRVLSTECNANFWGSNLGISVLDPTLADRDQRTPLHWAADRNAEKCLQLLLDTQLGSNVDAAGGLSSAAT